MAGIRMEGIVKRYPDGFEAVKGIDLEVADGEFLVLVGPSGCGKSTALRMVAGLEDVTSGTLQIGDRVVNDVAPPDRDVAMVFQNYALYPHMSVRDNMAFSLRVRGAKRAAIEARVLEAAELLDLTDQLDRKPPSLSGGQRQRVAMGRAIVREPQAFLMDEPLSNLDAKLRVEMRSALSLLQQRLRTTTLYVTHDQVEAMTLGDRVAVMRNGRLEQVDAPQDLYDRPANVFVASFIGSPAMNLLWGVLEHGALRTALGEIPLPPATRRALADGPPSRSVIIGIRPEDLHQAGSADAGPSPWQLEVQVELVELLGSETLAHFPVGDPATRNGSVMAVTRDSAAPTGHAVARLDARSGAIPGASLALAIDPERLHLFEADGAGARIA